MRHLWLINWPRRGRSVSLNNSEDRIMFKDVIDLEDQSLKCPLEGPAGLIMSFNNSHKFTRILLSVN